MTSNEIKTKYCNTCDTTRTVEAFSKHKGKKDGLRTQCKSCAKAYQQANKEQIAEYKKVYYKANVEQIAEQQKVNYQANREQKLEKQKVYDRAKLVSMTQAEQAAKGSVEKARARSELSSDVLYGGLTYTEACVMTLP